MSRIGITLHDHRDGEFGVFRLKSGEKVMAFNNKNAPDKFYAKALNSDVYITCDLEDFEESLPLDLIEVSRNDRLGMTVYDHILKCGHYCSIVNHKGGALDINDVYRRIIVDLCSGPCPVCKDENKGK